MISISTLSTHTCMRDAFAALTALSAAYHAAHKRRETVSLMLASHSAYHAGGRRLKVPVETVELRCHTDMANADQMRQMAWFMTNVKSLASRPAGFEGAASPLCT